MIHGLLVVWLWFVFYCLYYFKVYFDVSHCKWPYQYVSLTICGWVFVTNKCKLPSAVRKR